jgi:glutathione S-transferase
MLEYPIEASKGSPGFEKEKYPLLYAWLDVVQEREAYKVAVKKAEAAMGKPYTLKL